MLEVPEILARLRNLTEKGSGFFGLFDRSLVPKSRTLELIDLLAESIPEEIRQANDIISRREQILEEAESQAGSIVDDAVKRAEKLVDGDTIMVRARDKAKKMEDRTEEYIASRLEEMEKEIEGILDEVKSGIRNLKKTGNYLTEQDNLPIDKE